MSILRTDDQADSIEILKLVVETKDYYREIASVLEDGELANKLEAIANERESFIEPFQNVVKDLGELPAKPDPDKTLMQVIEGELTKLFSVDEKNAILDKCLQEDEALETAVKNTELGQKSEEYQKLLDELAENINNTKKTVQALKG
jgi:rubrerythrin